MKNRVLTGLFILVISLNLSACQNKNDDNIKNEEKSIQYYKYGEYDKALSSLKELADEGNINASFYLGEMFRQGNGIEKNNALSFKYYLKAAEGGKKEAFNIIGESYYIGKGVDKNISEGFKWYLKAAENGDNEAA